MHLRNFVFLYFLISFGCSKSSITKTNDSPPINMVTPSYELAWQDNLDASKMDVTNWYHRYTGVCHDGFNDISTITRDGLGAVKNSQTIMKVDYIKYYKLL